MRWQNGAEGESPIKGHLIQAKRVGIVVDRNQSLMLNDGEDEEVASERLISEVGEQRVRRFS
jgi:hypothetical protein